MLFLINRERYFDKLITYFIITFSYFFTECQFGKTFKELGSTWFADLGPPFGVMYCIRCECVPVSFIYNKIDFILTNLFFQSDIYRWWQKKFYLNIWFIHKWLLLWLFLFFYLHFKPIVSFNLLTCRLTYIQIYKHKKKLLWIINNKEETTMNLIILYRYMID